MSKQARSRWFFLVVPVALALASGAMAQGVRNLDASPVGVARERATGAPATKISPPGATHLAYEYDAPRARGGKAMLTIDPTDLVQDIERVRKRSRAKKPAAKIVVAAPQAAGRKEAAAAAVAPAVAPPAAHVSAPEPAAATPAASQERKVRIIPLYSVPADNQR